MANTAAEVCVLRLEFEVFVETHNGLSSLGTIACRDLVLFPDCGSGSGVLRYSEALGVRAPEQVEAWRKLAKHAPWVEIIFGAPDPEDERHPFLAIKPFNPAGRGVLEYDFTVGGRWVRLKDVEDEMSWTNSKARRTVDRYGQEWGERLVRRTKGGQRRINLRLLRELVSED